MHPTLAAQLPSAVAKALVPRSILSAAVILDIEQIQHSEQVGQLSRPLASSIGWSRCWHNVAESLQSLRCSQVAHPSQRSGFSSY